MSGVTYVDAFLSPDSDPARYDRTSGGLLRIEKVTLYLSELSDQAQWLRDSAACLIEAAEVVEHLERARPGGESA